MLSKDAEIQDSGFYYKMRFLCLSFREVIIRGIRENGDFRDPDFYLPLGEASKSGYYNLGRNVLKGHWVECGCGLEEGWIFQHK